ncbi:NEDD8 protease nep2 [Homalodisca vitripennis]|nr:NEDD8 protease nep2 [Homalodisca vitripennis]
MVFPAGILQSPFFNAKVPMYVNFAKIGAVVGHEIIHGFDDKLNGVNTQGENIADSAGLKLAYRAYKRLKRMEAGLPNLEQYNNDQLFMLSAATLWCSRTRLEMLKLSIMLDTHSPKEFRVKGSFANMPAFGKIFQCELGTPMNPHKKCSVW